MAPISIAFIFLLLSAFFSSVEIAFLSINKLKLEIDRSASFFGSRFLSVFTRSPRRFLLSMLLGNYISIITYAIFAVAYIDPIIRNLLSISDRFSFFVYASDIFVVSLTALIFAEFLPRLLFRLYADALLKYLSLLIGIFYFILSPFVFIFVETIEYVTAKLGHIPLQKDALRFTPLDVDEFINEFCVMQEQNENYTPEIRMVQNVIELKKSKVRDCMLPGEKIVSLEINTPIEKLKQKFIDTGFSKIPIYQQDAATIVGYVHAYDLFKKPAAITQLIRPIYGVSSSMPSNAALTEMIEKHISISIVVDDYKKLLGLLTLEDLMEEIFGEIEDEFDR